MSLINMQWARIPKKTQQKLLNNVWCGKCLKTVRVVTYTVKNNQSDLIIEGKCNECGHTVARLVEQE